MKQFKVNLTLIRQDGERVILNLENFTEPAVIMAAIGIKLGEVTDPEDWPVGDVVVDIPDSDKELILERVEEATGAIIDLTGGTELDEELGLQIPLLDETLDSATGTPALEEATPILSGKIRRDT